MIILCDTCSVLMVIRIAPDMFLDQRYKCITTHKVRDEIFQTQKFKDKYPWRNEFKDKIVTSTFSQDRMNDYSLYRKTIENMINAVVINQKTGKIIDLSNTDQELISFALAHSYKIATGDVGIIDFCKQEFNKKCISSLGLINNWVKKGLIKWNNDFQLIFKDWQNCNEKPQPKRDIDIFEKLTGYKYIGP